MKPLLGAQHLYKGSVVAGTKPGYNVEKVAQIMGVGKEVVVGVGGWELVGVVSSNARNGCY